MGADDAESVGWAGALAVADGALCYVGALSDADGHHHAATQIVSALSGSFELTDGGGHCAVAQAAIIPSSCEHSIRVGHRRVRGALVFLDPGSALGSGIAELVSGSSDVTRWVAAGHEFVRSMDLTTGDPASILEMLADVRGADHRPGHRLWHPSVRLAVERVTELLPEPVTLVEVANSVGLSPSRLSRLFNEQVGQSFPAYIRWRRLHLAIEALQQGVSLTDAAHTAGFTDSAHANRVCHEMFGLSPSLASRHLVWG
ncbi:AraC family transcriptional regulator [Mycolicibacterium neoaurum]|uniref:helix-turn-helix transcriptional regulator n=1 Tax=Mycolicibacterium neoaurum TaxID=1795 RepID=UPI0026731244|nr:AraC family transcriptional regulator [Mycolicibacterium neoaurum]MDO3401133.1 AraC family transcriptional regulator [Mycolicibacterium neoaurum]